MHNKRAPSKRSRWTRRHDPGPDATLRRVNKRIRRLNCPQPPAKAALRPGTVVWAEIPFADGSGTKTRPAVVIERARRYVVVRPVTSAPKRARYARTQTELSGWKSAGLSRPSAVQSRLVELDRSAVGDVVGVLAGADRTAIIGGGPDGH
jgi:hypothetical protein